MRTKGTIKIYKPKKSLLSTDKENGTKINMNLGYLSRQDCDEGLGCTQE